MSLFQKLVFKKGVMSSQGCAQGFQIVVTNVQRKEGKFQRDPNTPFTLFTEFTFEPRLCENPKPGVKSVAAQAVPIPADSGGISTSDIPHCW